jgi:hypothetical protein
MTLESNIEQPQMHGQFYIVSKYLNLQISKAVYLI